MFQGKASTKNDVEVTQPAVRDRRAHTAPHSGLQPKGAAQKRQKQRLPQTGGRVLGGEGSPILPRPWPDGPGALQDRVGPMFGPLQPPQYLHISGLISPLGCEKASIDGIDCLVVSVRIRTDCR